MIISHSHKFIFMHVPKTAGTTLTKLLIDATGHRGCKDENQQTAHETPAELFLRFKGPPDYWGEYIKICAVRNPWERVNSYTLHKQQTTEPDLNISYICDFLDDPRNIISKRFISRPQSMYWQHADFVIRFERLHEGFERLCQLLGITGRWGIHLNERPHMPAKQNLSAHQSEQIAGFDQVTIHRFGYKSPLAT